MNPILVSWNLPPFRVQSCPRREGVHIHAWEPTGDPKIASLKCLPDDPSVAKVILATEDTDFKKRREDCEPIGGRR